MSDTFEKYGWPWPIDFTDLEVELTAIQWGGKWNDQKCGVGLYQHYRNAQSLLWPEDEHHRWSDLMLNTFLHETITVVQGGKDSSKTRTAAKFVLVDYWAHPDDTLIMISSTEMRGADYRIWGDLKSLLSSAKDKYEWLPGKVLESKHAICTDDLEDNEVRDPRKGLIFIPCFGSGGQWVGLSRYAGIKQKRRRLVGDECFVAGTMVDMPDGRMDISQVQKGDAVWTSKGVGKVVGVGWKQAEQLVTVTSKDGRTVTCTPNHEFLTTKGWVRADALTDKHFLKSHVTKSSYVRSVEHLNLNKIFVPVYNLHVEPDHNYSVNGFTVHNCQFMLGAYIDVLTNINSGDFKGIFLGNPIGQNDPLDKLGEPIGGWGSEGEIKKTSVWKNKYGGKTICLYGPDSPNFDFPQTYGAKRFKWMIGQRDIDWVKASYGEDSATYWMQVMGVRRAGITARKVITEQMCKRFRALEPAVWSGGPTTMIAGLDAAYGGIGGDRCVLQIVEFGPSSEPVIGPSQGVQIPLQQLFETQMILKCYQPIIVPVSVSNAGLPEDQIAEFCKNKCESMGVPASNFFFDGRGTMAMSLAKVWSPQVNAVEFGGTATKRPVSQDHWVVDPETRVRRLKRCEEEYSRFVTELWFTVRYIIESGQMRELPESTMKEGCQREWKMVTRDRKEVETKTDMKERTNQSPDIFDALAIACEGARRRGFTISKMSNVEAGITSQLWIDDMAKKSRDLVRRHELDFSLT